MDLLAPLRRYLNKESRVESKTTAVMIVSDGSVASYGIKVMLRRSSQIEIVGEHAAGGVALAELEWLKPSVIVVDQQLSDMSGVEATQRFKESWPNIKVILMASAGADFEQALKMGVDACFVKGSGAPSLSEVILKLDTRSNL